MKIKVKLFGNCKDIFKNSALHLNFNKKIKANTEKVATLSQALGAAMYAAAAAAT